MKVTMTPIVVGTHGTVPKACKKSRTRDQRKNHDHRNHSTVVIGNNTSKNPGYLGRVVVTQTPVKDHQLKTV